MKENTPTDYQLALGRLRGFSEANKRKPRKGDEEILRTLFVDMAIQRGKDFPDIPETVDPDTRISILKDFTLMAKQPDERRCYVRSEDGHVFYVSAKAGAFLDQLMRAQGVSLKEEDFRQNPLLHVDKQTGGRRLYFLLQNYSSEINRSFRTAGIIGLSYRLIQHRRGRDGYWYAAKP